MKQVIGKLPTSQGKQQGSSLLDTVSNKLNSPLQEGVPSQEWVAHVCDSNCLGN
jgi:hypothetical protein